eukprot:m.76936 g.76936  ORF g.76936 m.76936 type:complete len:190 (+) comp24955_c1_seq1:13-582(+)
MFEMLITTKRTGETSTNECIRDHVKKITKLDSQIEVTQSEIEQRKSKWFKLCEGHANLERVVVQDTHTHTQSQSQSSRHETKEAGHATPNSSPPPPQQLHHLATVRRATAKLKQDIVHLGEKIKIDKAHLKQLESKRTMLRKSCVKLETHLFAIAPYYRPPADGADLTLELPSKLLVKILTLVGNRTKL